MSTGIPDEIQYKNISAEEFSKTDFTKVTLVDLREKDELVVSGIEGVINVPFSSFPNGLDEQLRMHFIRISEYGLKEPVMNFCRWKRLTELYRQKSERKILLQQTTIRPGFLPER